MAITHRYLNQEMLLLSGSPTDIVYPTSVDSGWMSIPGVQIVEASTTAWSARIPRNVLGTKAFQAVFPGQAALAQSFGTQLQTRPAILERVPFKHQKEAADRALSRGCLLLGDALGLGKTTSAALASAQVWQDGRPVLVLAPSYLESVWRAELDAMGLTGEGAPFWAARGADPRKKAISPGVAWVFCHFDILRHWWSVLSLNRFSAVVFDEAHLLKNPMSARTQAAALVTPGTALRMVLTGTPVQNALKEAHTLLTLTTGPGTWGSRMDFRRRYAGAEHNGFGWQDNAPTHVDELQERLDDVYLRRDVSVLEQALPERTRRRLLVELPEETRLSIQEALSGYSPRQILDAIRKSQAGKGTLDWITKLRKATSVAKKKTTIEHVSSLLEQGDSAVVFTWTREMARSIGKGLGSPVYVVEGSITQHGRDTIIAAWKADPEPRPLVATFDTLSTGHTLTKANHVVFHDLDFVPAKMLQAEGRVYRIGASKPVQSWWMLAEGSLDPFIFSLVNRKAPATAVFGDMGTTELADFFGDPSHAAEVEDLLAWSLRQED